MFGLEGVDSGWSIGVDWAVDLDEDEFCSRSSGQGEKGLGGGVRRVSDAGDDCMIWAREVRCEESSADSWGGWVSILSFGLGTVKGLASIRTGDQDVGSLCHFGRWCPWKVLLFLEDVWSDVRILEKETLGSCIIYSASSPLLFKIHSDWWYIIEASVRKYVPPWD